jgi:hypothetical protein
MKHRNLFNMTKILTFIVIITLGLFSASTAYAAETTTVSVSAPSEVEAGEQFTVSIMVEPGTAIAGVQFNLSFDQSLVTASNVAEGNLLSQGGAATYFNPGTINNTAGTISGVAGAIITPGQTVSTAGTFATITLTANTEGGTCPLTLSGVVVGDADGQSVPVSLVSGQVIVSGQETTNQPPVLSTIGDKSVNEGQLVMFTISATDPDGDTLTYSASNLPSGASFTPLTRTFSWTPGTGEAGSYENVHFEVSDGELTDSEDITITVNVPNPPGGGGGGDIGDDNPGGGGSGGVGDDSEESPDEPEEQDEPDENPPVIQEVAASDIGTDSAAIYWTTTEPSTSQVEYWASPSQFSPLDETLVTEHVVYLTGLRPGTNYHYRTLSQDEAGNLVVSPEYDFTTPAEPAAFTVNWLTISPAETSIGQEVTINALVTNTGEADGSYDVTLSIDDVVEATERIVDLAGGASQEVTFTITRETTGVYTVDVNGTTGTLVVNNAYEPEAAIGLFGITPNYESDTGVITFTRVDYGINESYYSMLFSQPDIELILKVDLNDKPLEEVVLIASGQSEPDMSSGSVNYIPAESWTSGTYTFQAELRTSEGVIEVSPPVRLIITPATAAGVASWATLGEIIGGVLIISLLAVLLILHRNRDMLRAESPE